ncbi:hypothetical protein PR003_g427 [Phytophthora rubi]|uniref:RxLR effector protein n=1 Tax=Phytophthora rubi TaxID=129364 RepID=A0A6A3NMV9_9STRA|nr:hypothetical protein PR002_g1999 [Phytophthora rubi]KAE9360064.1 hypothetical protein PR003_g427 [Phytophthora rubi]
MPILLASVLSASFTSATSTLAHRYGLVCKFNSCLARKMCQRAIRGHRTGFPVTCIVRQALRPN